jgi:ABC-type amino acid transport substrate-binding protein
MRHATHSVAAAAALCLTAAAAAAQAPRRTLTFCAGADNLPMSQEGSPAGFEVEIARALAARLGAEARFVWLDLHGGESFEQAVLAGRCDAALGAIVDPGPLAGDRTITGVTLTPAFYGAAYQLIRRAAAKPVRSLDELGGTRVAVEGESIVTYTLRQRGRPVHVLRTAEGVIDAVADGRASYGYLWGPVAEQPRRDRSDVVIDAAFEPTDRWNVAMAVREKDRSLQQALTAAGRALIERGVVARTLATYRLPCCAADSPDPAIPPGGGVAP